MPLWSYPIIALAAATAVQTYRLDGAQDALAALQASIDKAASQSEARAAQTGLEAVTRYVQKQEADAPTVERVVTRVRDVCLRKPADRDLSMSGTPGASGQASREAQDDATFAQAIADDLAACSGELNRLDAIRQFHNANVGGVK